MDSKLILQIFINTLKYLLIIFSAMGLSFELVYSIAKKKKISWRDIIFYTLIFALSVSTKITVL